MAELKGNKYGTHRVIEPKGVLTQAAWKIDNDMTKVYSNEIVCDVTSLNIDSASFLQTGDSLIDIQLLCLIHNVGWWNECIHIHIHIGIEIFCQLLCSL